MKSLINWLSKEYEGRGEFGCWIWCVSVKKDGSLYCINIEAAIWSYVIGDDYFADLTPTSVVEVGEGNKG